MLQVTEEELKNRLRYDNPWWSDTTTQASRFSARRHFFTDFFKLITLTEYNRAVILLGMRRIGKTVMMRQAIDDLIATGIPRNAILYASLDQPIFTGEPLERLVNLFKIECGHGRETPLYIFFDEIQYLKNWEIHLKVLVDDNPHIRFCASGSAAAALKRQSRESGAGRFTDFFLPGITFAEFCAFRNLKFLNGGNPFNIDEMNDAFIDYINFGGFPETAIDGNAADNFEFRIGQDITDRVLLRDLPSLYGINDPQELNRLFVMLAYNSGQEISLDGLSQKSNVAKNTIRRYLDYLEAAFLIRRIYRLDQNARRFQRDYTFKVYLTNTSLRTALFGPLLETDEKILGRMVETAYLAQSPFEHITRHLYYVRGRSGVPEVDFVTLDPATQHPITAIEVKWSDRIPDHLEDLRGLEQFLLTHKKGNGLKGVIVTTKTKQSRISLAGLPVICMPAALLCNAYSAIWGIKDLPQIISTVPAVPGAATAAH